MPGVKLWDVLQQQNERTGKFLPNFYIIAAVTYPLTLSVCLSAVAVSRVTDCTRSSPIILTADAVTGTVTNRIIIKIRHLCQANIWFRGKCSDFCSAQINISHIVIEQKEGAAGGCGWCRIYTTRSTSGVCSTFLSSCKSSPAIEMTQQFRNALVHLSRPF